jgi:hypothetical protein
VLRAEWIQLHSPFQQVRLLIPNPVQQSKKKIKSISVIQKYLIVNPHQLFPQRRKTQRAQRQVTGGCWLVAGAWLLSGSWWLVAGGWQRGAVCFQF